jgi:flagellar biosynthesis protein FliP
MSDPTPDNGELEVRFKPESGKAIIEGKTVVPFQAFIALILQRKVTNLLKTWGKAPIIVDSELLTSLASAPQDSQENRANLVLVTLVAGILAGVTGFAVVQIVLMLLKVTLGYKELGTIVGSVLFLLLLVMSMMKGQKKPKGEKLMEVMEKAAGLVGKK